MSPEEGGWRAFHLFYFDSEHVDRLLVEAGRLISELAPRPGGWFFIRYPEGGMHLRFRLRDGSTGYHEFLRQVRTKAWEMAICPGEMPELPEGGFPDERGHFHYPGSIVEVPYLPETERYGGPQALPENEALFAVSTSIAIKLISRTLGDLAKRAKLAIDLMLVAAIVAANDAVNARRFFEAYSRFWSLNLLKESGIPQGSRLSSGPTAAARLQRLREYAASDASPKSPSELWLRRLAEARRRFGSLATSGRLISPRDGKIVTTRDACDGAVSDMIMSQLHMMNNRLGIPPYVEMMWAAALARSLGR